MSTPWEGPRTKETLEVPQKDKPHSGLVDLSSPPVQTALSPLNTADHASLLTTSHQRPPASPPIPARSPLRPQAKSISSLGGNSARSSRRLPLQDPLDTPPSSAIDDNTIIVDLNSPAGALPGRNSYPSMHELVDAEYIARAVATGNVLSKSLTARPDSSIGYVTDSRTKSQSSSSSSSLPVAQPQSTMTKRKHALQELLSSERAYASDLTLIKGIHLCMALGLPPLLNSVSASPPSSSGSSSRTLSTASDSSTASLGPPMTDDDVQRIFSNIEELLELSDQFCEELEVALGSAVEGAAGDDDRVGELFLAKQHVLQQPYEHYITRHPNALRHLQNLPRTPALERYLAETRTYAIQHSHAWDLASLLIKPVQRLLKYPLLLSAIIDETPNAHPDKGNLIVAKKAMEDIASKVNEGRRRKEVVEGVLAAPGKKSVNVTMAASVNIGKVKNLRMKTEKEDDTKKVDEFEQQLKRIEVFAQQFAKDVVEWARSTSKVVGALRTWSIGFGKVIGLSVDQESEAFEAFLAVVERQLMPLCADLEAILNERLLREIAHLLKTMSQPYKLLASLHEQEPLHYHYLNMPQASKNRQAHAAMQAASLNYTALRGQLLDELPRYLALLQKGMAVSVRRLADIQMRFWKDVKDKWGELWEMLRVEGELNAGYEETINVWSARWSDVDEVLTALNISQAKKIYQEPERARPPTASGFYDPSIHSRKGPPGPVDILSSLEPAPTYSSAYISSPLPFAPSVRSRGRNSEESSRRPIRRSSNDSLHSTVRSSKGKSPARRSDRDEYQHEYPEYFYADHSHHHHPYASHYTFSNHGRPESTTSMPAIPRRKSMPLGEFQSTAARRATSPGDYHYHDGTPYSSAYANHPYSAAVTPGHGESYVSERSHHRDSNGNNGRSSRSTSKKRSAAPLEVRSAESLPFAAAAVPFAIPSAPNGKPQRPPAEVRSVESLPFAAAAAAVPSALPIPSAPNGKPQRPAPNRNRSSSITSFFKSHKTSESDSSIPQMPDPKQHQHPPAYNDQWATKPAKYVCQVIHPCQPPTLVSYFSFPFFELEVGHLYEVLQEAGHPSIHPKLPLYVDEGEDCLLLCRDRSGQVGWALASFLEPVNIPVLR